MTVQGTVNKTGLLLLFVVATAAWTWGLAHSEHARCGVYPWMIGGLIGGLVVALVTMFQDGVVAYPRADLRVARRPCAWWDFRGF